MLLHGDEHRTEFDEDGVAAEFGGDFAGGAAAGERVKDGPAWGAAGQDARPDQDSDEPDEVVAILHDLPEKEG